MRQKGIPLRVAVLTEAYIISDDDSLGPFTLSTYAEQVHVVRADQSLCFGLNIYP